MRKLPLFIFIAALTAGCASFKPMNEVISTCDKTNYDYNNYVYCIKMSYAKNGYLDTSDPVLRIFYTQLDMISQYKNQGKISDSQAKEISREIYKDYLLYRAQYDKEKSNVNWAAFGQSLNQASNDMVRNQQQLFRDLLINDANRQKNQLNCTSIDLGGIISTQCR